VHEARSMYGSNYYRGGMIYWIGWGRGETPTGDP
jgi:hypothetical protein